jgi:NADPH:quinone reductase-like Zn-dependent oxidoreductase
LRALYFSEHGNPNVLQYGEVADPIIAAEDVIVRVRASALNRIDVVQRAGTYTVPGFQLPHIGGLDVAGEIEQLGAAVQHQGQWQIGDRVVINPSLSAVSAESHFANRGDLYGELGVIGLNAQGGHADLCAAPASHIFRIPDHIDFDSAAAFPTAWMTAHHGLFSVGALNKNETVLIHAAASGVSSAAIQLAKAAGARVLATAGSTEKCAHATMLGADAVLNNRTADITSWVYDCTEGVGANMVFDHVGPALWQASLFAMAPQGRLVSCGNTTGDSAVLPSLGHLFSQGLQIRGCDAYRFAEFAPTWKQFCDGAFNPCIDSSYDLREGIQAHQRLEQDQAIGKIILKP